MDNPYPIKVVLADDHEYFRVGFKKAMSKFANNTIKIIDEAKNGQELIEVVNKNKPDIVLTDIQMPVMDGIQACTLLNRSFPEIGIIGLSFSGDKNLVHKVYNAGARGFLLKTEEKQEILKAIQIVYNGDIHYSNSTATLIASIHDLNKAKSSKNKSIAFTEREIQIIRLICQQFSTKEIAQQLNVSTRTIDDYRYKIQEKTNSKNMVGIAMYAIKHGIIHNEEI